MVLWFSSFSVGVSSVNLSSALAPTLRLTPRLSHHVLNRQLHINGVGIWAEPNIKKQYCHHLVKQACTPEIMERLNFDRNEQHATSDSVSDIDINTNTDNPRWLLLT